jgi:hypothetical protein
MALFTGSDARPRRQLSQRPPIQPLHLDSASGNFEIAPGSERLGVKSGAAVAHAVEEAAIEPQGGSISASAETEAVAGPRHEDVVST